MNLTRAELESIVRVNAVLTAEVAADSPMSDVWAQWVDALNEMRAVALSAA